MTDLMVVPQPNQWQKLIALLAVSEWRVIRDLFAF
jgi:hypothetical protein